VVKARVTSINLTVAGSIPASDESCCSSVVEQRKENAAPLIPAAEECRDGAEESYFVCETMRGCCSAALLDNSSRLEFAGANR
jgi:hypothetical protein